MFDNTVNFLYDAIIKRLEFKRTKLADSENVKRITFENLSNYTGTDGVEISYDLAMIKHVFGKKFIRIKIRI
ncbi:hypothetical protein [Streptococcus massiliensis]|uniref:Uncharacterized protein n=1 Tax=Streptococcus massiliensis TaxID=313439 RepID=A0A380KX55_9STRE|nr:hypothetical protein [Streptococcus massiliensis]SUN76522.1 Uncharacterised protein [Streptococcus massiliensis]